MSEISTKELQCDDTDLADYIDEIVQRNKHRTAIFYSSGQMFSYAALDELANRYAHYLNFQGLSYGDTIGIFHDQSVQAYALMLAAIKNGIIYCNLDSENPTLRLQSMLSKLEPKILFHAEKTLLNYDCKLIQHVSFEQLDSISANYPIERPALTKKLPLTTPVYIVFTSGSTGTPKGAVMSQGNIISFSQWIKKAFDFTITDRFTAINPAYFDNSVFDFFASLFSGATLCPIPSDIIQSPSSLIKSVNNLQCTVWFSVPSLLIYCLATRAFEIETLKHLRYIIFGGEAFPMPLLKKLYQLHNSDCHLVNVYGPSECTCISSFHFITQKDLQIDSELAPLGRITNNFDFKIFDQQDKISNIGELYLTGDGVGLGYYKSTALTNAAFVTINSQQYYKTGDLVELKEDGLLYFRGRRDNQVKHMGYRIELEEIEAQLNKVPQVKQSIVVYQKNSETAGQIIAYVIEDKEKSVKKNQKLDLILETYISNTLPRYMQPRKFIFMDEFPKNRNGKIDRKKLKIGEFQ